MRATSDLTLDSIQAIENAKTAESVVQFYSRYIEQHGFTGMLAGHLVNPFNIGNETPFGVTTWPTALMLERRSRMAFIHDPVIKYALRTQRPFRWSTAYKHATRYGLEVTKDARDFGMGDGLMLPMIDMDSTPGGISLSAEKLDFDKSELPHIQLVSQHCYYKLQRLLGPFPYEVSAELTQKESDALQFAASGKTAWETGIILGLTETSVKDALKRASRKLEATNKTHAVASAMAKRLIV